MLPLAQWNEFDNQSTQCYECKLRSCHLPELCSSTLGQFKRKRWSYLYPLLLRRESTRGQK